MDGLPVALVGGIVKFVKVSLCVRTVRTGCWMDDGFWIRPKGVLRVGVRVILGFFGAYKSIDGLSVAIRFLL